MFGRIIDTIREAGGLATEGNDLLRSMHPKQLAFFADPARSKSLLGGRQGAGAPLPA